MVDLIAKSPAEGRLPVTKGALSLAEVDAGVMTLLHPYKGQSDALSDALKSAHGMAVPQPGRATGKSGARAIWFGLDQTLLVGPKADAGLGAYASVVDQSDAWSVLRLDGDGTEEVLARWVPVDLRRAQFKRGHTVRSDLGHMQVSITRISENAFWIMGFRSMAATLVHELSIAMAAVTARHRENGLS